MGSSVGTRQDVVGAQVAGPHHAVRWMVLITGADQSVSPKVGAQQRGPVLAVLAVPRSLESVLRAPATGLALRAAG